MTIHTPIRSHGGRYTKPLPVFSQENWNEVRDALVMALDAPGDGPQSADRDFCRVNSAYALSKLKQAQKRQEKAMHRRYGVSA